jgi:hypothetical protein
MEVIRVKDYIRLVTGLIGLIIALMGFASTALDLVGQPEQLHLFSLAGYIVFSIGVLWFAFGSEQIPRRWRLASLGGLYIATILFFIWVGTWKNDSLGQPPPPSDALEKVYSFDFEEIEDPTDISPWYSLPDSKTHTLLVSHAPELSCSGEKSLRLKLNIQPFATDPNEYGGIAVTEKVYPALTSRTVNAAEAWILVPESEQAQNSNLQAHIMAYTFDRNGGYIGLYSEDVELKPGAWTPVFWGGAYTVYVDAKNLPFEVETESLAFISNDRKMHEFYLTVWSDAPYSGSIYFDDIVMYTTGPSWR